MEVECCDLRPHYSPGLDLEPESVCRTCIGSRAGIR